MVRISVLNDTLKVNLGLDTPSVLALKSSEAVTTAHDDVIRVFLA